jgi:LacI family transcriptional regulator
MSKSNPTIKDVAKEAGVSIATVSRVINNLDNVNSKTLEKVNYAIYKLNYKRNLIASSLKTNDTKFVGIIAPEIGNVFFTLIFDKLEKELSAYGYNIIFCTSENNVEEEKKKYKMLLDRNVDGIILIPVSDNCEHITVLDRKDVPVVIVDRYASGIDCDMVLSNNIQGAYALTKALIDEGYKKIGFLGGARSVYNACRRLEGYEKAMKDSGLEIDENFVRLDGLTQDDGYALMKRVINEPNRPNAFVVENDMIHIGLTSYLKGEVPYDVRKDIVFASYDFLPYAALLTHCHYAMAQPLDLIGVNSAKLLVDRMRFKRETKSRKIVLEPRMKVLVANGGIFSDPINQDAIEPAFKKIN